MPPWFGTLRVELGVPDAVKVLVTTSVIVAVAMMRYCVVVATLERDTESD